MFDLENFITSKEQLFHGYIIEAKFFYKKF